MLQPLLGQIMLWPSTLTPDGWMSCDGAVLNIADNTALFSVLGREFGGDAIRTFGLPNLNARLPADGGLRYLMNTDGAYPVRAGSDNTNPDGIVGTIMLFPSAMGPLDGYVACDGSTLPLAPNAPLFEEIGTTYGGDGQTDFAVPALSADSLGYPGGLSYLLCNQGYLTSGRNIGSLGPLISSIWLSAAPKVADGFQPCDGRTMPLDGTDGALFSLLGTTYGGDGQTTFGLPKLAPPANAPDPHYLIATQGVFPSTDD